MKLYNKFPFNQCSDEHLKDTSSLIKNGVNLSIQLGLLDLLDEEDEEDDTHDDLPPSPIITPVEPPKSSLRRASSSQSMSLVICINKIENIIQEYFPMNNEKIFTTISNYVINLLLQNEDIEKFVNKIINHKFKNEMTDEIRTLFIEKYEEIKLEELIDYLNNYLQFSCENLQNPYIYKRYYKIWKYDVNNYKFYEEHYFFDYFNKIVSLNNMFLQNAFLINYKRFMRYFSLDLKNYEDDEEEIEIEPNYVVKMDQIQLDPLSQTPKSLRFSDDIDIININRNLPVDHVIYKRFIDEIENT